MEKLYGYGLKNGFWGVGTQQEVKEMCKDWNTTIYNKELATYEDVDYDDEYANKHK